MIIYKLLWTVLGIKNNWYGSHSYNNDAINLLKPDHHHKSVLDDLINLFLSTPHIMYKILYKTSTISVYHYVLCVGTPTCHSVSSYSIPFHLTALLPLSIPQSPHTDLVNGSLTITAKDSLTPSFSIYFHEQRKRPPAKVLHPTSQAYQLCQPANGRADWTAGDRNKRSPFGPTRFIHSFGKE